MAASAISTPSLLAGWAGSAVAEPLVLVVVAGVLDDPLATLEFTLLSAKAAAGIDAVSATIVASAISLREALETRGFLFFFKDMNDPPERLE
ncbi:hypothetical protein D3C84_1115120 [compost metagenome]